MIARFKLILLSALCFVVAPSAMLAQSQPASSISGGLRATILGSGSPQYNASRAGPAVLIQLGATQILVDTGNGVQGRLEDARVRVGDLDGLFFIHHHLDHNEEFIPIFIRALLGGNPFQVAGPAPMAAMVRTTLEQYREDINYRLGRRGNALSDVNDNYRITELKGGESFALGGVTITTTPVNHTIETLAYRFDADGRSVVISGDLTYSASLSQLAKGADWLIIDSGGAIKIGQAARPARQQNQGQGQGQAQGGRRSGGNRAHVTLEETARMANEAGVKGIVLTHFTAGDIDEAATIAELRKAYAGEILFGADLLELPRNN
jgi:ribonuclease BN (tRNA processing enzyme)